jgi:hypothetical protein
LSEGIKRKYFVRMTKMTLAKNNRINTGQKQDKIRIQDKTKTGYDRIRHRTNTGYNQDTG